MSKSAGGETVFDNTIIRASAGTGKTFQLSNRYLRLVVSGVAPETILASTFTRKAAGEILDRIIQRLARGASSEELARELAAELGQPQLDRPLAQRLVNSLLRSLDRLQISTLDSFYAQLARRFCLELGLSPHWAIVDEARDAWLREEAARRILSHGQASELVHLLAKGETDRSISTVIDDTLRSLYDTYLDADDSAWSGLPKGTALDSAARAETIQELRDLPLEKKSQITARANDLTRFEASDFDSFISKGLAKAVLYGSDSFNRALIPAEVRLLYGRLLEHVKAIKLHDQAARLAGSKKLLDAFDNEYDRLKHQEHALRFGDVTRQLDMGRQSQPPTYDPLNSEQRIDHLLLDEFQDTSPIQWRIIQPIAEHVVNRDDGSFLCVGDTKQAIYGWRGGVAEIIDEVEDWLADRSETKQLFESYRSSPVIMQAVNDIFENLDQHPELGQQPGVVAWRRGFETHKSALPELSGHVCLSSSEDPFVCVAERIAQEHDRHPNLSVAVLVRSNADVGRMMNELSARGVPASEESGKSITDSAAVQIVLAALRWIDSPGDSVARFHIARTPLGSAWNLNSAARPFPKSADEATAARLRADLLQDGYGQTLESWVGHLLDHVGHRERRRLGQLVDMAYLYDRQASLRPYDFVQHVAFRKISDPSTAAVRVMNIHQAKGLEFDVVYLPDLEQNLVGQPPPFVTERPRPIDRVSAVSPYLNQDLQQMMPEGLTRRVQVWQAQQMSESLCLLYVALTRAARALYLVVEPPKSASSKITKTWSGLILAGLNSGKTLDDGEIGYEIGESDWADRCEPSPVTAPQAQRLVARRLRFPTGPASRSRLIRATSPSAHEGGQHVSTLQVLRSGSPAALTRGSAVHAVFEHIDWLPRHVSSDDIEAALAAFPLTSSERQEIVDELVNLLATDQAQDIVQQDRYRRWLQQRWPDLSSADCQLTSHREYAFATILDDQLWTGSIDRLVWIRQGGKLVAADILDFKTDFVVPDDPQALAERGKHYRPQLQAYRRAISQLTRLSPDRIAARLWFVRPNRLVNVD